MTSPSDRHPAGRAFLFSLRDLVFSDVELPAFALPQELAGLPIPLFQEVAKLDCHGWPRQQWPVADRGAELRVIFLLEGARADPAAQQILKGRVGLQEGDECAGVFVGLRDWQAVDIGVNDSVADEDGLAGR